MRIERHLVRNTVIEHDVHDRDIQRFVACMGDRQAIAAASFTESAGGLLWAKDASSLPLIDEQRSERFLTRGTQRRGG